MQKLRMSIPVALMLMVVMAFTTFGQLRKKINYTINVPYQLRMGDYLIPEGKYVLYQIHDTNLNLFALYPEDMTNEPIAMIHTTRIDYQGSDYPQETKILLNIDESSRYAHPIIRGWNIPGFDGWEVISVVAKKDNRMLTRVR